MTFRLISAVTAAIVALPTFMHSQQAQQPPVLRVGIDLVRVDVSVLDSSGAPVEGLTREAFTLRENAHPVPIDQFSPGPAPATYSLVLDTGDSLLPHLRNIERAARAFLDQMREGDEFVVSTLGDQGRLTRSTTDAAQQLAHLRLDQQSHIWRALQREVTRLRSVEGRRAVVLITDGADDGDWVMKNVDAGVLRPLFLTDIRNGIASLGVDHDAIQIYVVPTGSNAVARDLRELADGTGGLVTRFTNDGLVAAMTRLVNIVRNQYVLGFTPGNDTTTVRRIEVALTDAHGKGRRLHHRRSYVLQK